MYLFIFISSKQNSNTITNSILSMSNLFLVWKAGYSLKSAEIILPVKASSNIPNILSCHFQTKSSVYKYLFYPPNLPICHKDKNLPRLILKIPSYSQWDVLCLSPTIYSSESVWRKTADDRTGYPHVTLWYEVLGSQRGIKGPFIAILLQPPFKTYVYISGCYRQTFSNTKSLIKS